MVTPPVVTPPVVTPPVVGGGTTLCTADDPTINSSTNGTFSFVLGGMTYTGSIVNGVLFTSGLNASGSGSGIVSGTLSGSSGGNDGYVLSTGLTIVSGSASGTATIAGKQYYIETNKVTKKLAIVGCLS